MRNWRQAELAARAGVRSRRFTGSRRPAHRRSRTSYESPRLGAESALDRLFEEPPYASLDEALTRAKATARQRAPRHK
jgi:hypothetical protein